MSLPLAQVKVDPQSQSRAGRVDPLAEHRRQIARQPVSPELLILLRASGHRGPVLSQLHGLELLGFLAGHRAGAIEESQR